MVFSSALFLFVFFPIVVAGYFLANEKLKNIWLLLVSLFFYSWGEPKYIILMLISIIANYLLAFLIDYVDGSIKRKVILILDVVINLGLLGYFKYFDFFATNVNRVLGTDFLQVRNIALPIGISFYTFQSMSYVIDVYRKKVPVQKSLTKLGLYISFFPQLIAGPIVRYIDIEKEISDRTVTFQDFYYGCRRFMIGFAKKILIADQISPLVETIFSTNGTSAVTAWIGAIAYTLQIFFDFSGYSDMAIGIGRMFGFHFMENFNYPYISKSIQEFWRRWHISLSSWFRDYVYIPLGGSRCSTLRTCMNYVIVFFLTGLWHGASWNFVVWGLYYVVFLISERLFLAKILKRLPAIINHLYTVFLIIIGWVFFRADGLRNACFYIKNMFHLEEGMWNQVIAIMNKQYWICLVAGVLLSIPWVPKVEIWLEKHKLGVVSDLTIVIIFLVAIGYLLGKGFSPFLYFRF